MCNKDVHQQIIDDAVDIAAREGRLPEQADFMTASVINHKRLSPEEQRILQADLRAAELGTSSEGFNSSSLFDEESFIDEESYFGEEPDLFGETCPDCGFDKNYCICRNQEKLPVTSFNIVTACPNNPRWYEYAPHVPRSEVEETKKRFIQSHEEECGCGAEITVSVDDN